MVSKAAEADDNDAIFALGRCYKEGIGTAEDWDKALEWFGKGAEKEESRCLTELGLAYEMAMAWKKIRKRLWSI